MPDKHEHKIAVIDTIFKELRRDIRGDDETVDALRLLKDDIREALLDAYDMGHSDGKDSAAYRYDSETDSWSNR